MKRGRQLTCREPGSAQCKACRGHTAGALKKKLQIQHRVIKREQNILKLTLRRHCIISCCFSPLSAQLSASWTMTPLWPAAKMASTPWTSSSNSLRNCRRKTNIGKTKNPEQLEHSDLPPNFSKLLPFYIWPRLRLASGQGSWRWDGGRGQPGDPSGGFCRGHGEEACGTAEWWSLRGDWKSDPLKRPEVDWKSNKKKNHEQLLCSKQSWHNQQTTTDHNVKSFCVEPDSRSSTVTRQVLRAAFKELFAEFGTFSVTYSQHGLENCTGNSICNTY